jgi:hypothetical protein
VEIQTLVHCLAFEAVPLLKPSFFLVYQVLLHLHKRMPLGSFFRLLEEGGKTLVPAGKLLEVYAREQNREMLRNFYYSDDRRVESAVLSLGEASRMQVRVITRSNHELPDISRPFRTSKPGLLP